MAYTTFNPSGDPEKSKDIGIAHVYLEVADLMELVAYNFNAEDRRQIITRLLENEAEPVSSFLRQ